MNKLIPGKLYKLQFDQEFYFDFAWDGSSSSLFPGFTHGSIIKKPGSISITKVVEFDTILMFLRVEENIYKFLYQKEIIRLSAVYLKLKPLFTRCD